MEFISHDGVHLAYIDEGGNKPAVLLLHGCGLDHVSMDPVREHLRDSHRVVTVDLRGHGESDAPHGPYDMAVFAEDVAFIVRTLKLESSLIIGHSMGGNVALLLADLYPELVSALILIDSALLIPEAARDSLATQFRDNLAISLVGAFFQNALRSMCLPSDRSSLETIEQLKAPAHVLQSALPAHTLDYDGRSLIMRCKLPTAYIHSNMPFVDLALLRTLSPKLLMGATLGSGHLSPLEVPDQLGAMIGKFLAL